MIKSWEMSSAFSMHGGDEKCRKNWLESERKRPLRRPRHRWEDSIKIELMENGDGRCGLNLSGSG
jgi:hypothetical protein